MNLNLNILKHNKHILSSLNSLNSKQENLVYSIYKNLTTLKLKHKRLLPEYVLHCVI